MKTLSIILLLFQFEYLVALFDQIKFDNFKSCLIGCGMRHQDIVPRNEASEEYEELNYQWNELKGMIFPLGYLIPRKVSDVQAAVKCCQETQLRLVSKCGGHSFVKHSFGDSHSVILDLKEMNDVKIIPNTNTANVGGGTTLGQLQYKLLSVSNGLGRNYLAATGLCPSVGIGGQALGGGFGAYSRLFGLVSDNMVEFDMVDARGYLFTINNYSYPDLFWALRGGGGGNFGIVTRFKIKIHPEPNFVIFSQAFFKVDDFIPYYSAFQIILTRLHDNSINMFHSILGGSQQVIKLWIYKAEYKEDLTSYSNSMQSVKDVLSLFPTPINSTLKAYTYEEILIVTGQNNGFPNLQQPSDLLNPGHFPKSYVKTKNFYVTKLLTSSEIIQYNSLVQKYLTKNNNLYHEHYGNPNAINLLFKPTETAFVHRQPNILYNARLAHRAPLKPDSVGLILLEEFFIQTQQLFNHTTSYQNYLDENMDNYLERYYGQNLNRLIAIKRSIDPGNFFHHSLSIPT